MFAVGVDNRWFDQFVILCRFGGMGFVHPQRQLPKQRCKEQPDKLYSPTTERTSEVGVLMHFLASTGEVTRRVSEGRTATCVSIGLMSRSSCLCVVRPLIRDAFTARSSLA